AATNRGVPGSPASPAEKSSAPDVLRRLSWETRRSQPSIPVTAARHGFLLAPADTGRFFGSCPTTCRAPAAIRDTFSAPATTPLPAVCLLARPGQRKPEQPEKSRRAEPRMV